MVVDDVDEDLEAGGVEGLDHGDPFAGGAAGGLVGGVAAVGREEVDGVVAPVIMQSAKGGQVVEGVLGFVDGEEFDGGNAEAGKVGRSEGGAGEGALEAGGHSGVILRETAEVDLVDDVVFKRSGGLGAEVGGGEVEDDAFGGEGAGVDGAIGRAGLVRGGVGERGRHRIVADFERVGVEEEFVGVEAIAGGVNVGEETGWGAGSRRGRKASWVPRPGSRNRGPRGGLLWRWLGTEFRRAGRPWVE